MYYIVDYIRGGIDSQKLYGGRVSGFRSGFKGKYQLRGKTNCATELAKIVKGQHRCVPGVYVYVYVNVNYTSVSMKIKIQLYGVSMTVSPTCLHCVKCEVKRETR